MTRSTLFVSLLALAAACTPEGMADLDLDGEYTVTDSSREVLWRGTGSMTDAGRDGFVVQQGPNGWEAGFEEGMVAVGLVPIGGSAVAALDMITTYNSLTERCDVVHIIDEISGGEGTVTWIHQELEVTLIVQIEAQCTSLGRMHTGPWEREHTEILTGDRIR